MIAVSRILNFDYSYTEKNISSDVLNYVQFLEELGVTRNDRITISADNSYSFVLAIFSLIHIDCSIVLVDSSLGDRELLKIVNHSNSNFCITDRLVSQCGESIHLLTLPFDISTSTVFEGSVNMTAWKKRDDALILYTSGSTGEPKGIIKSGESFITNIESTIKRMEYDHTDVLLPLIPFTHFYGLSIIFIWWIKKCDLVLCDYRSIRSVVKEIITKNITVVDAVPSTYYVLNRLFTRRKAVLSNIKNSKVRMWCVGGSPLSQKLSREFSEYMEMPLLDGYGLSEAGNVALNTSGPEFGCGKPLDDVLIKIVNCDRKELAPGQLGEILVQSPSVMKSYHQLEENTNLVLQNGWLITNDLGYIDPCGNLFIIGRKGDEIIRKGYIIYPASIEKTLEDVLGMKSKVVSFKDEKKGAIIVLLVEADNDTEYFRNSIYASLDAISKPDKIYIVKHFPYLNNGKIDFISIKNLAFQLNKK